MKASRYFFVVFISLGLYTCSEADAKQNTLKAKSNAFDNIDNRDKKLFTKQERIKSYSESLDKSKSIKKALSSNSNSGYSGYGSSPLKKNKTENRSQKNNKKKTTPKVNLQFSAYSTN